MKLKDIIKTIEIKIPETDIVIRMKTEISWYESQEILKVVDDNERGVLVLSMMIQEWNIEGENDKPIPITVENIKNLPGRIISPLVAKANELTAVRSEKKKI
jgi:hypothetical protein